MKLNETDGNVNQVVKFEEAFYPFTISVDSNWVLIGSKDASSKVISLGSDFTFKAAAKLSTSDVIYEVFLFDPDNLLLSLSI